MTNFRWSGTWCAQGGAPPPPSLSRGRAGIADAKNNVAGQRPGHQTTAARALFCSSPRIGRFERAGTVRQAVEEGHDIGPLAVAREACEGHLSAGDVPAWIGQELVELLQRPATARSLHRAGIVETRLAGALAADHAPEIRSDLVRAALVEAVAGLALLGRFLAAVHIGAGQEFAQRLLLLLLACWRVR